MSRPTIFISAPCTSGDYQLNVLRATRAAEELWRRGYLPVTPHLLFTPQMEQDAGWSGVMEACKDLLLDCDAVVFLPGWQQSRGCRFEHGWALGVHQERGTLFYGLASVEAAWQR